MDVSFASGGEKFNYRACGIFLSGESILAIRDERSPCYTLPGGRVRLGETAEAAVIREAEEELGIMPQIIRPLWLNQAFFTDDVDGLRYHELCLYFLMDAAGTGLAERGETFTRKEGQKTHIFTWLHFDSLASEYFYPRFMKTEIYALPERFTLRMEVE